MEPSKNDWKLFNDKISDWQEAYMEKVIVEYTVLLNENLPASAKFWEMERRIKKDKKKPGIRLELRKQEMVSDLLSLINDGVITMDDLEDFSQPLKDQIKFLKEKR